MAAGAEIAAAEAFGRVFTLNETAPCSCRRAGRMARLFVFAEAGEDCVSPKASFTNRNPSPSSSSPRRITFACPFIFPAPRGETNGERAALFTHVSATSTPPRSAAFVLVHRDNLETKRRPAAPLWQTKRSRKDPQRVQEIHQSINNYPAANQPSPAGAARPRRNPVGSIN